MNTTKKMMSLVLSLACVVMASQPANASDRVLKGALIGGGVGAVAGHGGGDVVKGAVIGGGVAAATQHGRRGREARDGAVKGAVIGGVIGGVAGNGMHDAARGAALGAAGGAIIGGH